MPKKVKIDDKELMVKLMNHFWVKGFLATTIEELAQETGLSKSYIYTNYGKKGLFEEVFYFYMENYTDPFLQALMNDTRGKEAFQDKFSGLADSLINQTMPKACLFVNTVVEMGNKDRDIVELNEMYIKRVAATYSKKLKYCYHIGEIKQPASIPFYTDLMVNLLFSLAVLYKTQTLEELETFISSQLDLIR